MAEQAVRCCADEPGASVASPPPPLSPPLLPSPPASPPSCAPDGYYTGSAAVLIDFSRGAVAYSNLGGSGVLVDLGFVESSPFLSGEAADGAPPQGIYYSGVGTEVVVDGSGERSFVAFDLYVRNASEYAPADASSSGTWSDAGEFGSLNLAEGQLASFEVILVQPSSGARYAPSQPFTVYLLDVDTAADGGSAESVAVCGLSASSTSDGAKTSTCTLLLAHIVAAALSPDWSALTTDAIRCSSCCVVLCTYMDAVEIRARMCSAEADAERVRAGWS